MMNTYIKTIYISSFKPRVNNFLIDELNHKCCYMLGNVDYTNILRAFWFVVDHRNIDLKEEI